MAENEVTGALLEAFTAQLARRPGATPAKAAAASRLSLDGCSQPPAPKAATTQ